MSRGAHERAQSGHIADQERTQSVCGHIERTYIGCGADLVGTQSGRRAVMERIGVDAERV